MAVPMDAIVDISPAVQAVSGVTQTRREKHCSFDDAFRYAGMITSIGGVIGCLLSGLPIGAAVFGATGALFLAGHITDKTRCGAKARIIKIANARIQSYDLAIQHSHTVAHELQTLTEARAAQNAQLERQELTLTLKTQELQQEATSLRQTLQGIQQENERLQATSTDLQSKIQIQEADIRTLNEQIRKFTEQNQAFHEELQKIVKNLPIITKVTGTLSRKASRTRLDLEKNMSAFEQQMAQFAEISRTIEQMGTENVILKATVGQLQTQTNAINTSADALGQHLQTIAQLQQTELEIQQNLALVRQQTAERNAARVVGDEKESDRLLPESEGETP